MTKDLIVDDLLNAYLHRRRLQHEPAATRADVDRRYRRLALALGVDLDAPPAAALANPPEWWAREDAAMPDPNIERGRWIAELHALFEATAAIMDEIATPFSDLSEASPQLLAYYKRYGGPIGEECAGLLGSLYALLRDLAKVLWALPDDCGVTIEDP